MTILSVARDLHKFLIKILTVQSAFCANFTPKIRDCTPTFIINYIMIFETPHRRYPNFGCQFMMSMEFLLYPNSSILCFSGQISLCCSKFLSFHALFTYANCQLILPFHAKNGINCLVTGVTKRKETYKENIFQVEIGCRHMFRRNESARS